MRLVRQTRFGDDGNCLQAALASLMDRELADTLDVLDGAEPEENWGLRMEAWGAGLGWLIEPIDKHHPPEGLSIAVGPTSRGNESHAVIALDGQGAFDPHFSNKMIDAVDVFITVRRMEDRA